MKEVSILKVPTQEDTEKSGLNSFSVFFFCSSALIFVDIFSYLSSIYSNLLLILQQFTFVKIKFFYQFFVKFNGMSSQLGTHSDNA